MSAYSPPSHAPPALGGAGPSSGVSGGQYAPTTVPTPGQPLLRNGKMLIYPHGWRGCPKCQDTGYKHGDPSHPCRKCWQDYGQTFNPLLISSSGLQGAKVLQKPLPPWTRAGIGDPLRDMPGQYPLPVRMANPTHAGYAGYPGAAPVVSPDNPFSPQQTGHNPLSPQATGYSHFSPQPTGTSFAPPAHPPPPNAPPRRGPPRVNRTDESREEDLNEEGEAPPAYEDAVAAGPDGALPPQRPQARTDAPVQQGYHTASIHPGPASTPAVPPQQTHFAPPSHAPHISPHQQYPQMQAYGSPPPHAPWGVAVGGPGMGGGHAPMFVPRGHVPPPHALVVRPGDPRIGGRLCHKCGGGGVREGFWFGDRDTCWHCNGTGRIL